MNLSLLILLLFIVLFIIGFMYIEPIISKHKVKNNNEYGSARFSTEAEINKYFTKERLFLKILFAKLATLKYDKSHKEDNYGTNTKRWSKKDVCR